MKASKRIEQLLIGVVCSTLISFQDSSTAEEPTPKEVTVSGTASGIKTQNGKVIQTKGAAETSGGRTATAAGETIISRGEKGVLWNGKRKIVTGNGHTVSLEGEGAAEKTGKTTKYEASRSGASANGTELWKSDASGTITHSGSGEASYEIEKAVETKGGETYTADKNGTVTKTSEGLDWNGTNTTTGPKGNSRTTLVNGTASRSSQGVTFSEKRQHVSRELNSSAMHAQQEIAAKRKAVNQEAAAARKTSSVKPKRAGRSRGGRGR